MDLLHNTYGSFRGSDNYERHQTLFSLKTAREQERESSAPITAKRDSIKNK